MEKNKDTKDTENVHAGHRKRMVKRFQNTFGKGFEPHELLEMLLYYTIPRANTNKQAHLLLQGFDSLPEMFCSCGYSDFVAVEGVGEKTATMLAILSAIFKSGKYDVSKKIFLKTMKERCDFVLERMKQETSSEEILMAVCLSEKMQVMRCEVLERGTFGQVNISIGKLAKFIFRADCSSVILVHNHPDGDVRPSYEDVIETKNICNLLSTMEIKLIDHIITGEDTVYSMAKHHDF